MIVFTAVLTGFLLDILFGDPTWIPHPVVYIGRYITWLEGRLRKRSDGSRQADRKAGRRLVFWVIFTVAVLSAGILVGAWYIHPVLYFAIQTFWSWQCLAHHGLKRAGEKVYRALQAGDLRGARSAVGEMVGRDTNRLTEEGAVKAAIESMAENTNDGIIAPLLYLILGGAPLGLVYKAINTMDSMVGYHNEQYEDFGRAAARLDDIAGWIPARITGVVLGWGAGMSKGTDGKSAKAIRKRDGRLPDSPNAGIPEATVAGALGVQLGGPAYYGGVRFEKPYLGDDDREAVPGDIVLTQHIVNKGVNTALVIGLLLRLGLAILIS